jgi:Trk K+ transport system NAD-binding subunit
MVRFGSAHSPHTLLLRWTTRRSHTCLRGVAHIGHLRAGPSSTGEQAPPRPGAQDSIASRQTKQPVVITGLSRVAVRVAQLLSARDTPVVLIASKGEDEELIRSLPSGIEVVQSPGSCANRLCEVQVHQAEALLVLSDDDLENLRFVAAAHDVAPNVPVVLRVYDARLVEQFQSENVRRCYSASGLAAPAFVAGVFGQEVVETLRIAEAEVPLCMMTLGPQSPLLGLTSAETSAQYSCAAVARASSGGAWQAVQGEGDRLAEGDQVLIGGLLLDVLGLAVRNSEAMTRQQVSPKKPKSLRHITRKASKNLVPASIAALVLLVALTSIVFAIALELEPIDAVYKALRNAFGAVGLDTAPSWLKLFGVAAAVGAAIIVGAVLSQMTAKITADRWDEDADRRARRMRGHVVVAGLGLLGFRINRLLHELGVPTVIIEQTTPTRFREAAAFRTPVLAGDVRLAENLERAGIREAMCLIACTDDDLANITSCVQAAQLNPSIRTVARIFDEDLAQRLGAFDIDVALSTSTAAAGAFIAAATDERAIRRIDLPGLRLLALMYEFARPVDRSEIDQLREQGVHLIAVNTPDVSPVRTTRAHDAFPANSQIVIIGPADAVDGLILK